MACYIPTRYNRHYAAVEGSYGVVPQVSPQWFPAVRMEFRQRTEQLNRKDKTGTRTYQGAWPDLRSLVQFEVLSYLVTRDQPGVLPGYGALMQGALGGAPAHFRGTGATLQGDGKTISLGGHGMQVGQGVAIGSEIRFVEAIPDAGTVVLNAPFVNTLPGGVALQDTVTIGPAARVPSLSLFDYRTPEWFVQRLARGAGVDEFEIRINGDFHEFAFRGIAAELIDNVSFAAGQGGLSSFPSEPAAPSTLPWPVPGHLGQAWIGVGPSKFNTLTSARIRLRNNLDRRNHEFGTQFPQCLIPGEREVTAEFELYGRDEQAYNDLWLAAKQRAAVPLMLQLGVAPGNLFGVRLGSFVPEVPEFLDDEERLRWRFSASRAQGSVEDEIHVAFC
jgi:hypothetical protein